MPSVTIQPAGSAPASVNFGDGGGTLTNDGPGTVYYRDEAPVTSATNDGTLASGSSTTFTGTQYFAASARSSAHYIVNPVDSSSIQVEADRASAAELALGAQIAISVGAANYAGGAVPARPTGYALVIWTGTADPAANAAATDIWIGP